MNTGIIQRGRDEQIRVCEELIKEIPDNAYMLTNKEQLSIKRFLQKEIETVSQGIHDVRLMRGDIIRDAYLLGSWYHSCHKIMGPCEKSQFICAWMNRRVAKKPRNSLVGVING